jgi:site-specific DNA-cytosine methylase
MKVLSLFDGISAGQVALERVGISCDYYASEIDRYAIKVTQANYPDTTQLGDVTQIKNQSCDLLLAGSPCQGFSFAGKQLNFEDERSKLFFEFLRIKEESSPKYFLLENVKMKQEYQDVISKLVGVQPIKINSALVSGQNRTRLYWTNIPFLIPNDKGIEFKDILETGVDKKYYVSERQLGRLDLGNLSRAGGVCFQHPGKEMSKCPCLMARHYKGISGREYYPVVMETDGLRKLSPEECEKLQTFPVGYTKSVSDTQRYKALGNSWSVDIISRILKGTR